MIRARQVSKVFGSTMALDSVSLDLLPGEVHVLLGENGAGKSTLAKILAGIVSPDSGRIEIGERLAAFANPGEARRAGIELVQQETTVVPKMSVVDNVTLGWERAYTRLGLVRRRRMREDAVRLLRELAPDIPPDAIVDGISGSQKHRVAIARALFSSPRVLILDEPTAALDELERESFFSVVRRVTSRGVAVLYVTHHLAEVPAIGSRVTIMRDGAIVARCAPDTPEPQLVAHIAGRQISMQHHEASAPTPAAAAPVLETVDVCAGEAVDRVSMHVRPGEVLGVYGVGQCGADELAEVLSGHRRADRGRVFVAGRTLGRASVSRALARGVAYVPGERGRNGVVGTLPVRDNITLSVLPRLSPAGVIRRRAEARTAARWTAQLRIKTPDLEAQMSALSGGNQQKVLLARALACETPVLLLKEPTAGIDVQSRQEIYTALKQTAKSGTAIVVITSDLLELLTVADRALVLYRGRVAGEFAGPALTEEAVLGAALGGSAAVPHDSGQ
ncbi:ABC-type sugar transport system [Carbonactinospora thermoautotrophica]|uniref:ABC-type sugar transport system n=1 Tax=Carbonactinospora thermoautotrophica TaxID=1469144 RepID=A0A132MSZ8_9ACTN|nr:sugar ABC transporter ATP-binding protein [Carbonactinospora thermoautotrophica]KWX00924.1 ABC-type sugar transport system [Carbonactinospora thermoautotrophica]